jgi:hypothetical protein
VLRTAVLCALAAPLVAPAAPVPPTATDRIAADWGTAAGAGTFALERKRLVVSSAASFGAAFPTEFPRSAPPVPSAVPRVERAVAGDFELTVRVAELTAPGERRGADGRPAGVRGGLFVAFGTRDGLHLSAVRRSAGDTVTLTHFTGCQVEQVLARVASAEGARLRVTRSGNTVTVAYAADGETWIAPHPTLFVRVPERLTVGLFAAHNIPEAETRAAFDSFALVPLK